MQDTRESNRNRAIRQDGTQWVVYVCSCGCGEIEVPAGQQVPFCGLCGTQDWKRKKPVVVA
jgi:hypothetical protein